MRTAQKVLLLLMVLAFMTACKENPLEPDPIPGADIRINGTVRFVRIEGGFWSILGDDGVTYDPLNGLAAAYCREGLRVRLEAKRRDDLAGIHMAGPIVEVLRITVLR